MVTCLGSKSALDNFGKFIDQFQPKPETLSWKFERILIKLYRLNVSLLFNPTDLHGALNKFLDFFCTGI